MSDASHLVNSVRVLVVDDQPMVRQGLSMLLELLPGIEIAGQGENGQEALALVREVQPDLVLMDVRMPVMSGPQATAKLREQRGPPVILMTTFEEADDMIAGIQAGAAGYLFKNINIQDLQDAIRRVLAGEKVIHPRVAQALAEAATQSSTPKFTLYGPLTEREQEILLAIHDGRTNKQIASDMGISEGTVKTHLSNLFQKLGASNRTEAVYRGRQLGLLSEGG